MISITFVTAQFRMNACLEGKVECNFHIVFLKIVLSMKSNPFQQK